MVLSCHLHCGAKAHQKVLGMTEASKPRVKLMPTKYKITNYNTATFI